VKIPEEFKLSNEITDTDVIAAHSFISKTYWAKGISFETFKKAAENSVCFKITKENLLVGFARVITDKTTFAYLCDVFIKEEYRGKKLSISLMEKIISHPDLQGLRRWTLATSNAHGLYKKFGFKNLEKPEVYMELHNPDIYQKLNQTDKP